jgi:hypothetical protein
VIFAAETIPTPDKPAVIHQSVLYSSFLIFEAIANRISKDIRFVDQSLTFV